MNGDDPFGRGSGDDDGSFGGARLMDSHGENPFANEGDDDDGEVSVTPSASPAAPHDPHVALTMRPDAIDSRRPERPGQHPRDSRRDLEAPG